MDSEYWASLDQHTSFAKDPWLFDRPENRKKHSVLSKVKFAEWPNTTSNFSLHRGVAPAGKLNAHHKSRFVKQHEGELVSSPSCSRASEVITTRKPCCAISDAQLRATINTRNGIRCAQSDADRTTTAKEAYFPSATHTKAPARQSADNVTAASTLLQQAAAEKTSLSRKSKTPRCIPATQPARHVAAVSTPPPVQQGHRPEQRKDSGDGNRESSAISNNWSVTNIGFNDIKSEAQARIERENQAGYVRAAFASQRADKPYIAEAAHFRFRYPHTLGRIAALSDVRSDRVDADEDRVFTNNNHKRN